MLLIFRRHKKTCPYRKRDEKRCSCSISVDGVLNGVDIKRVSLRTSDWNEAQRIVRECEATGEVPMNESVKGPITIADAKSAFFADLTARKLAEATKYKHKILFKQLEAFSETKGLRLLKQIDPDMAGEFRASWKDKPHAAKKKLERFRQFCRFALGRRWIDRDPTQYMIHAVVKLTQTPPFERDEMCKILVAARKKIAGAPSYAKHNALRIWALILFLRYSGLRIGDAVGCRAEWVTPGKDGEDGYVELVTRKNNVRVHVPLPPYVIDMLDRVPRMSDERWFWTGKGKIETAVKDWQGRLAQLFKDAGIQGGHAHRFRDTFAVAMLEERKSLQVVADFLGNTLAVTQKHYNPGSKKRQEQAGADARATWANDPFLKMLDAEARGTSEVREKVERLQ